MRVLGYNKQNKFDESLSNSIVEFLSFELTLETLSCVSLSVYSRDFQCPITAFARILFWVMPMVYEIESRAGTGGIP